MEKQTLEVVCLESIWSKRLERKGWSERLQKQLPYYWAKSTLELYNRLLNKLKKFCVDTYYIFPPRDSEVIAEFLCFVADSSPRPRSQLVTTSAAITCLYEGLGLRNIMDDPDLRKLVTALIKSGTCAPRIRSSIIPLEPFHAKFREWPDNDQLDVKSLRMKTLVLLAFVLMLRPSDVAPKAQTYNPILDISEQVQFSTDNLSFNGDGSLTVIFYGIKNDYHRDGFSVHVPPASDSRLDPVNSLRVYIEKTSIYRGNSGPVFMSLNKPYRALGSSTISKILQEAIDIVGLQGLYTPKCFRPSGATYAIESNINPDSVRRQGRWKSPAVFEEHYVHAKPEKSFTDRVLSLD